MRVALGSFALGGAGNQTIDTGGNFAGKALILWGTNQTSEGFAAGMSGFVSYSISSASRVCMSWASDDNVATQNRGGGLQPVCLNLYSAGTPTVDAVADFVSFGTGATAGQFTINVSDAPAGAVIVHYQMIGGDGCKASIVSFVAKITSTGNKSETGAGFMPDAALFMAYAQTAQANAASYSCALGAAVSTTARGSCAWGGQDAQTHTAKTKHVQDTTKCLSMLGSTGILIDAQADFVSWDAAGFTLNWTDFAGSAWRCYALCLKGDGYDVDLITAPASTGLVTTATGFPVAGAFIFGTGLGTADATLGSEAVVSIGALGGSPIGENNAWWGDDDTATSVANSRTVTTKVLSSCTNPSTIVAEADGVTLDSLGGYGVNFSTTSSGLKWFGLAFKGSPLQQQVQNYLHPRVESAGIISVAEKIR